MHLGHSEADNQYVQWLLEIGTGSTIDDNKMIQVPQSMICTNLNYHKWSLTVCDGCFDTLKSSKMQS